MPFHRYKTPEHIGGKIGLKSSPETKQLEESKKPVICVTIDDEMTFDEHTSAVKQETKARYVSYCEHEHIPCPSKSLVLSFERVISTPPSYNGHCLLTVTRI